MGVILNFINVHVILENANDTICIKLNVLATKHKANVYYEHLICQLGRFCPMLTSAETYGIMVCCGMLYYGMV